MADQYLIPLYAMLFVFAAIGLPILAVAYFSAWRCSGPRTHDWGTWAAYPQELVQIRQCKRCGLRQTKVLF